MYYSSAYFNAHAALMLQNKHLQLTASNHRGQKTHVHGNVKPVKKKWRNSCIRTNLVMQELCIVKMHLMRMYLIDDRYNGALVS